MEGIVRMTHTAFVDLLVGRFDIQYKTQTPVSVEFTLNRRESARRGVIGLSSRRLVFYCESRG